MNAREHIFWGAYVCISATYITRREFPVPRPCTETAVVSPARGFLSVCPDIASLQQPRRISVALRAVLTPPSFSLVSKEHLQLSYLCASFLFLRVLPLGPESCWFYLHNRFLIPAVLSGPTAIPFSALVISWLGCHQFQFFLRSLNCPFPHSILYLSAGCPPGSPLSAQEPNSPQDLHLIFAKRPRSNRAQRPKQSGHDGTWEHLWADAGSPHGILTAPGASPCSRHRR